MRRSSKFAASLICLVPVAGAQIQYTKLYAADGVTNSYFGDSLALDGDRIVVGAPANSGSSTGMGAAYVFVRSGTAWAQEAKLVAADAESDDAFGRTVALDGDRALVGAPNNDGPFVNSGSASVFLRTGAVWVEEVRLEAQDASYGAGFGTWVAIDGDVAVVGAGGDDQAGDGAGAAYVFRRTTQGWVQESKLIANDAAPNAVFGGSVAVAGDTIAVGAYSDDSVAFQAGAAYVFTYSGGTWSQQAKLLPTLQAADQRFGFSIAADGDRIAVGSPQGSDAYVFARQATAWALDSYLPWNGGAFGERIALHGDRLLIGAPHQVTTASDSGAAFVYRRGATGWTQQGMLVPNDAAAADRFGMGVALSDDTAVVGSLFTNGAVSDSGAAYVLAVNDASATIRAPCAGGSIPNSITVVGAGPVLGTTLTITVNDPTNAAGLPPALTLTTLAISLAPAPGYPCGVVIPGWGSPSGLGSELLISAVSQDLLLLGAFKFWLGPAFPNGHSIAVPSDVSIVGLPAFAQGAFVTPTGRLQVTLTQGLDLAIGL